MLIQQLHHGVKRDKDFSAVIVFELELDLGPSLFDVLEFLLYLGFFLGHVDQFVHLGFEEMQLQTEHVFEGKAGRCLVEFLASEVLELPPVSLFHKLGVERTYQR